MSILIYVVRLCSQSKLMVTNTLSYNHYNLSNCDYKLTIKVQNKDKNNKLRNKMIMITEKNEKGYIRIKLLKALYYKEWKKKQNWRILIHLYCTFLYGRYGVDQRPGRQWRNNTSSFPWIMYCIYPQIKINNQMEGVKLSASLTSSLHACAFKFWTICGNPRSTIWAPNAPLESKFLKVKTTTLTT